MNILVADKLEAQAVAGLEALGHAVTLRPELDPSTLPGACAEVKPEAIVVRSTKVHADAMDATAGSLKLIIRAGAGYDNIDCSAAHERGVAVSNCPGMNSVAVAELTIGHLISLDRRLPEQDSSLRSGKWNKKEFGKSLGLKGRSLLVVGTGAIGIEVIKRARAFDMKVTAQSRSLTEEMARAMGVGWVKYSREALLERLDEFDAVSIHVPVTDDSKGMCNEEFFKAMKPGAMFINTSRGAIVDEAALSQAVTERGVRAGLDVYQGQPGDAVADWKPGLADIDGVHFTHHCGASTEQAQLAVADEVVRIIRIYGESGRFEHCVNGVA